MVAVQQTLLALAALISIVFGVRYFFTKAFMPYHATVAGKDWAELDRGVQTVILGMLKIIGGGFVSYGLALFWLLLPLSVRQSWAPWAALTISAASLLPTLYVTIALRRAAPAAKTPIVPAAVVLALTAVGIGFSFMPL